MSVTIRPLRATRRVRSRALTLLLGGALALGVVACETDTEDAEMEDFDDPGDDPTLDGEDPDDLTDEETAD